MKTIYILINPKKEFVAAYETEEAAKKEKHDLDTMRTIGGYKILKEPLRIKP